MSNTSGTDGDFEIPPLSLELQKALESRIEAAGCFVVPSENLRPNTLAAARDYCSDDRSNRRFQKLLVAFVLGFLALIPAIESLNIWSDSFDSVSGEELTRGAAETAAKEKSSLDWALQEAFMKLRKRQASHFESSFFQPRSFFQNR
jgi:hypothetical protein